MRLPAHPPAKSMAYRDASAYSEAAIGVVVTPACCCLGQMARSERIDVASLAE